MLQISRNEIAPVPAVPEHQLKIAEIFCGVVVGAVEIAFVKVPDLATEAKKAMRAYSQPSQHDQDIALARDFENLNLTHQKHSLVQSLMLSAEVCRRTRDAVRSKSGE